MLGDSQRAEAANGEDNVDMAGSLRPTRSTMANGKPAISFFFIIIYFYMFHFSSMNWNRLWTMKMNYDT